jgi:hypothetical protein
MTYIVGLHGIEFKAVLASLPSQDAKALPQSKEI